MSVRNHRTGRQRLGRRFRRWMLEKRVDQIEGHHEHHSHREKAHPCWKGEVPSRGVGYQPGIAALAAGDASTRGDPGSGSRDTPLGFPRRKTTLRCFWCNEADWGFDTLIDGPRSRRCSVF